MSITRKVKRAIRKKMVQIPAKKKIKNFRSPCFGGCGKLVISKVSAECRNCRRKRLRARDKAAFKAARARKNQPASDIETDAETDI